MTATLNASTSAGVILTSDTSGSLAIQSNGTTVFTASSTGISFTNATTAVPAFSAYNSAGLSISAATSTKMVFNIADFDTNSNYSIANNRFTPTVAGYYQISCAINFQSAGSPILIQLWKNNANYSEFARVSGTAGTIGGSTLLYANGTDYFEIFVYSSVSNIVGSSSGRAYGWFTASMVRST